MRQIMERWENIWRERKILRREIEGNTLKEINREYRKERKEKIIERMKERGIFSKRESKSDRDSEYGKQIDYRQGRRVCREHVII